MLPGKLVSEHIFNTHLSQDLRADADVADRIHGRHPEAQHVGAVRRLRLLILPLLGSKNNAVGWRVPLVTCDALVPFGPEALSPGA